MYTRSLLSKYHGQLLLSLRMKNVNVLLEHLDINSKPEINNTLCCFANYFREIQRRLALTH